VEGMVRLAVVLSKTQKGGLVKGRLQSCSMNGMGLNGTQDHLERRGRRRRQTVDVARTRKQAAEVPRQVFIFDVSLVINHPGKTQTFRPKRHA